MAATAPSSLSTRGAGDPLSTSPKRATDKNTASEYLATTTAGERSLASPPPSLSPSPSPAPSSQPGTTPPPQAPRRPTRPASSEYLSDKATAALIRRSLCGRHSADRERNSPAPIHDLLPPLTSRNDVDLQLYALISIIIREFVQNWYTRITPDETFIAEIVQVIAHCTRALEQRLRKVDLESLLFDELPELLAIHIRAYRIATNPTAQAPLETEPRQIYHSLWPLPALSPVPRSGDRTSLQAQEENESAYRQLLVHGVLAVLLPTEDLENECLTSLVEQILSELVIGNLVAGKLSEPWLIWELLIMTTRIIRKRNGTDDLNAPPNETTVASKGSVLEDKQSWSLHRIFWSFIHWTFLVAGLMRFVMSMAVLSRSLPPRPNPSTARIAEATNRDTQLKKSQSPPRDTHVGTQTHFTKSPIINFHIWRCVGDIVEVEARMPWLRGTLSMVQWIALKGPGRVASLNGTLDRLMSHYIQIHVLDPAHLPPLLRTIRAALFPNNAPGVSSLKPPSSGEQLAALRRRCASALWGLLPRTVGELYYGTTYWPYPRVREERITNESVNLRIGPLKSISSASRHTRATHLGGSTGAGPPHVPPPDENPKKRNDATLSSRPKGHSREFDVPNQTPLENGSEDEERRLSEIEEGIVDIFSDGYFNKHLIYGILELVLVRLVPELAEKGVGELWDERLH